MHIRHSNGLRISPECHMAVFHTTDLITEITQNRKILVDRIRDNILCVNPTFGSLIFSSFTPLLLAFTDLLVFFSVLTFFCLFTWFAFSLVALFFLNTTVPPSKNFFRSPLGTTFMHILAHFDKYSYHISYFLCKFITLLPPGLFSDVKVPLPV